MRFSRLAYSHTEDYGGSDKSIKFGGTFLEEADKQRLSVEIWLQHGSMNVVLADIHTNEIEYPTIEECHYIIDFAKELKLIN